jgi:hypothetical protein
MDQLSSHGLFNVTVEAQGDTWIDDHHTNEDIALALGGALAQALGDRKGINRFGDFTGGWPGTRGRGGAACGVPACQALRGCRAGGSGGCKEQRGVGTTAQHLRQAGCGLLVLTSPAPWLQLLWMRRWCMWCWTCLAGLISGGFTSLPGAAPPCLQRSGPVSRCGPRTLLARACLDQAARLCRTCALPFACDHLALCPLPGLSSHLVCLPPLQLRPRPAH